MRLPEWIRHKYVPSELRGVKSTLRGYGLSTVCEEARCPNKAACFSKPTATFMILGDSCTRNCGFCSVSTGSPLLPDPDEPRRVAEAAAHMGLKYVVITSVTRDDLPDGGAGHFAETIKQVRGMLPEVRIEVLVPDFKGEESALDTVLKARPDVFNHNVETVPSLYWRVRPQAVFSRSIGVLAKAKALAPDIATKSGLMLGLGEKQTEVISMLKELRTAGCDYLTIGQYLRPGRENLPVVEYIRPEVFESLRTSALEMGFKFVASSPLVRSSMNAEEMYAGKSEGMAV